MQWLIAPLAVYLVVTKWAMIKAYLPAKVTAPIDRMTASPQSFVVQCHSFALLSAIVYVIPFDLLGFQIQAYFYSAAMWCSLAASCITIVSNYGSPPVREGWEKCKVYLGTVVPATEFHWLFYATIFITFPPCLPVLAIPARRSLWAILKFAGKNMQAVPQLAQLKPQYDQLMAKEAEVMLYSAVAEVALGFYLILMLIFPETRSIMIVFVYWTFLRMRYQNPKSQKQQQAAWELVGQRVEPVLEKVPPLRKAVDYAKVYFQKPV
ncbi:unnamed protein product [Amoebophrya sp. A25]|nr:unnamed protein product [Amoebophrya sp. A25]|eukprot:GSA25T00022205001.1